MVLKFCGGLWDASRTDDDLDAASSRQRRLLELLRGGSRHVAKFKKEVRVVFDSTRPHGIQFVEDEAFGSVGYVCEVVSIDATPHGQAAAYNERCRAIGDYAHVIVAGMRVRSVDNVDVKDTAYDLVLARIANGCTGVAGCAITFADVSSPTLSPSPKLKTIGNVILATQRAQKSPRTSSLSPASPTSRRSMFNANASPKVSKWSSVLTAVQDTVRVNQADVLASDLAHKNLHLEAQLVLKGKLATIGWEKEALEKRKDETTHESTARLEKLQAEQDDLQSELEKLQAEQDDLQKELEKAKGECVSAFQQNAVFANENASLQGEITTLNSAMVNLQHEYDGVLLQLQELQIEHHDVQHHVEELHNRLVAAQLLKSELSDQITTIQREQRKDHAVFTAIQTELTQAGEQIINGAASPAQRRRSSIVAVTSASDSPTISLLKQTIQSRDALQIQNDELLIELSCHETTIQHQQDQLIELEDKLTAITQISHSLRDQVRTLMAVKTPTPQDVEVAEANIASNDVDTKELKRQLNAERSANARIQSALQTLEDRTRAKLEQHEKEQLFLTQFKEQLAKGILVTKYGTRGNPHPRVLNSDAQCHWISWRNPGDGSTSPRADAKAETLDLVEVLLGATTETFAHHRPEIPARCLSLVFCHPCRTLDLEVETRDRALFLRRGFRLLLEEAAEKRHHHEDEQAAIKH